MNITFSCVTSPVSQLHIIPRMFSTQWNRQYMVNTGIHIATYYGFICLYIVIPVNKKTTYLTLIVVSFCQLRKRDPFVDCYIFISVPTISSPCVPSSARFGAILWKRMMRYIFTSTYNTFMFCLILLPILYICLFLFFFFCPSFCLFNFPRFSLLPLCLFLPEF